MDWELSIRHLICGYIPVFLALVVYFVLTSKRTEMKELILIEVFVVLLPGSKKIERALQSKEKQSLRAWCNISYDEMIINIFFEDNSKILDYFFTVIYT